MEKPNSWLANDFVHLSLFIFYEYMYMKRSQQNHFLFFFMTK